MNFVNRFLDKHKDRIVGLDIMRSIAILIVVYGHGEYMLPKSDVDGYRDFSIIRLDGVTIFFVLSGFLIGRILLKIINTTNFTRKDLLHFWVRRWFRTIPNYILVLLILLTVRIVVFDDYTDINFTYFLFLQNFATPHPSFFSEAWSLSIEEWFYILFPLTCYFLIRIMKNKTKSILIAALLFLVLPLLFRIVKYALYQGSPDYDFDADIRKLVLCRLDSIMYGVLAAYIWFTYPDFWKKYTKLFLRIGLFLLVMIYFNPALWVNYHHPLVFNIESVTTFCFLPFMSKLKTTKVKFLDSFFIFISLISYSMYLLNMTLILGNVMYLIDLQFGIVLLPPITRVYLANFLVYWVLTIGASYLLYRFYENPMTQLRDRIKVK